MLETGNNTIKKQFNRLLSLLARPIAQNIAEILKRAKPNLNTAAPKQFSWCDSNRMLHGGLKERLAAAGTRLGALCFIATFALCVFTGNSAANTTEVFNGNVDIVEFNNRQLLVDASNSPVTMPALATGDKIKMEVLLALGDQGQFTGTASAEIDGSVWTAGAELTTGTQTTFTSSDALISVDLDVGGGPGNTVYLGKAANGGIWLASLNSGHDPKPLVITIIPPPVIPELTIMAKEHLTSRQFARTQFAEPVIPVLTIKAKEPYTDVQPNSAAFPTWYSADFIITATPAPTKTVEVYIDHGGSGRPTTNQQALVLSAGQEMLTYNDRANYSSTNSRTLSLGLHDTTPGIYTIGSPSSATVFSTSAAKPGITLSIEETTIDGEDDFTVKVESTDNARAGGLDVFVSFTDESSRYDSSTEALPTKITIPENSNEAMKILGTTASTRIGIQDTITVSVSENANYVVNPAVGSDSVKINGLPAPAISITDPPTTVTEGGTLTFNFMLDQDIDEDVKVSAAATANSTAEESDYTLGTSPQLTITEASGSRTGTITIPVPDDHVYEGNETVEITFTATNAHFSGGVFTHTLTVTIVEDESKPEISFKSASYSGDEGTMINLTLVASRDFESNPTIEYTLTNTRGNYLDPDTPSRITAEFVEIQATNTFEETFAISTNPVNDLFEGEGEITVTLTDPEDTAPYTIDSTMKTATVIVNELDTAGTHPELNISSLITSIPEGHSFDYAIERSLGGTGRSNVMVTVTASGTGSDKITLTDANGTAIASGTAFSVILPKDANYDGTVNVAGELAVGDEVEVTVALTGIPTLYRIGMNRSISVDVRDNDSTAGHNPKLSLTGPSRPVQVETNSVVFKIVASDIPRPANSVRFIVTQAAAPAGSFLGSLTSFGTDAAAGKVLSQPLSTSKTTTDLTIPIADPNSSSSDADGMITVTLLGGDGYTLADSPAQTHTVTIKDTSQLPVLTVTGSEYSDDIFENTGILFADFTVTATPAPTTELPIRIKYAPDIDHFIRDGEGDSDRNISPIPALVFAAENSTLVYRERSNQGSDNLIYLELLEDTRTPKRWTVGHPYIVETYKSEEDKPGITLSIEETSVDGGDDFTVKVESTHDAQTGGLDVFVSFSDPFNRYDSSSENLPTKITIPEDAKQATKVLGTTAIGTLGYSDIITVSVTENAKYILNPAVSSDSVAINAIPFPTVSIDSPPTTVTEGGTLTYNFSVAGDITEDITVTASVTSGSAEPEDYDLGTSPQLTVTSASTSTTNLPVEISITDDMVYEGNETVHVTFTVANAEFSAGVNTQTLMFTINDNEEKPVINFKPPFTSTVDEGAEILLTLTASIASETAPTVSFTPSNSLGEFLDTTAGASGVIRNATVNFQLNSGVYEGTISIPTKGENGIDEVNGEINVLLSASDTDPYTLGSRRNATVTIADVTVPKLTIQNAPNINAGTSAEFQITSDIRPYQAITVKYILTNESGNFLHETREDAGMEQSTTVTFSQTASPFTATISVNTQNDAMSSTGVIKITLVDDDATQKNYTFADTDNPPSATVNVANPNFPTISISSSEATVFTEAAQATRTYTFTLSRTVTSDVSIAYTISPASTAEETADFTLAPVSPLTIASESDPPTATLTITLEDDDVYEGEETIVLSLTATGALFTTDSTPSASHEYTVTITDDDSKPEIEFKSTTQTVDEGGMLSLTMVASRAAKQAYAIAYTPSNSDGNFLDTATGAPGAPGTISSTDFELDATSEMLEHTFTIDLKQDNQLIEDNGQITVVLDPPEESAPYTIDSTASTFTATVTDAGGMPPATITVTEPEGPFAEADEATLTYTFTQTGTTTQTVSVATSLSDKSTAETADFTESAIAFSGNTATLTIDLVNDNVYEGEETLVLTLTATNALFSTDSGNSTSSTFELSATITDDESKPEISFKESTDSVNEGESFNLTMVASVLSEATYSISYTPTDTAGNFLHATSDATGVPKTVDAKFTRDTTSNMLEQTIAIATRAKNNMDEDDGEITVTLDDPSGSDPYTISGSMKTVIVTVRDVDIPELSIQSAQDVSAGGIAEFQVSSDIKPRAPLTVKFTPDNQSGNFLETRDGAAGSERTATLTFPATSPFTQTLSVRTTGDPAATTGGVINVTLVDDSEPKSYTLVDDNNMHSATANVSNPTTPSLSITDAMVAEESQDGTASVMRFEVVLNPAAAEAVTVNWTTEMLTGGATEGADYQAGSDTLRFEPNARSQFIEVAIISDSDEEENEQFAVVLSNQSSNAAIIRTRAIGTITDNDRVYRVSIATENTIIKEGDIIQLRLRATPTPERQLRVRMSVAESSNVLKFVVPRFATFEAGSNLATYQLSTVEESVENTPARIEVKIVDGDGYNPGDNAMLSEQTVTIMVENRDPNVPSTKYSVASAVIHSILLQIGPTPSDTVNTTGDTGPLIEIIALDAIVDEGDSIRFEVAVPSPVLQDMTVNVELSDTGDFIGRVSETAVTILKGEESAILYVPTVDDQVAEEEGVVTARISQGAGYRISLRSSASVTVRDHSDNEQRLGELEVVSQNLLPAILGDASLKSLDIAQDRTTQAFAGGTGTYANFGEFSSSPETFTSLVQSLGSGQIDRASVIGESSFAVSIAPDALGEGTATVWGSGDHSEFSQNSAGSSNESWSGETLSGHFGFDSRIGNGILVGLESSTSSSNVILNYQEQEVEYGIQMSGLHTYMGIRSNEGGMLLQVTTGYGGSSIEREQKNAPAEFFDGSFLNFGLNGRANLLNVYNQSTESTTTADIAGSARMASQNIHGRNNFAERFQIESRHFQVVVDGSHSMTLSDDSSVIPSVALGLLGERKGNRDSLFATISNGVEYNPYPGLETSATNQVLMQELNRIGGWRLQKSADFDSGHDNLGLLTGFSGTWQFLRSANELKDFELMNETSQDLWTSQQTEDGFQFEATVGYGIEILDGNGRMEPFGRFALSADEEKEYGFGSRASVNEDMEMEMTATYLTGNGETGFEYRLNSLFKW